MQITAITVWQRDLPLAEPYWLSGGRLRFDRLDATFVRIDTDTGLSGWGEGTPWGETYLPAHGPGIRAGIQTMAPALLGLDPRNLNHVDRAMDLALPGRLQACRWLRYWAGPIPPRCRSHPRSLPESPRKCWP